MNLVSQEVGNHTSGDWIGLNSILIEGEWIWGLGHGFEENVTYTNWVIRSMRKINQFKIHMDNFSIQENQTIFIMEWMRIAAF